MGVNSFRKSHAALLVDSNGKGCAFRDVLRLTSAFKLAKTLKQGSGLQGYIFIMPAEKLPGFFAGIIFLPEKSL